MSTATKPLITFAIPSYNSEEYLHIALDSLLGHEEEIEVLVIDDGSKDQTLKIAETYAEKYPNIIPIHQENKGHGGAINTAVEHAKGLYFKVLDSDDWVNKDALSALLEDIKTLYIDDICVDESARGQHVGKALFEHIRNYAQTIGCHNITLNVWEGNTPALSFYQHMGMGVQKTGMEIILH